MTGFHSQGLVFAAQFILLAIISRTMEHCVLSNGAIAGVVIGLIALFIAVCVIPT